MAVSFTEAVKYFKTDINIQSSDCFPCYNRVDPQVSINT